MQCVNPYEIQEQGDPIKGLMNNQSERPCALALWVSAYPASSQVSYHSVRTGSPTPYKQWSVVQPLGEWVLSAECALRRAHTHTVMVYKKMCCSVAAPHCDGDSEHV